MVQILLDNPLLLLFVVAAIGYPIGKIKIGGSSLGVAAVLFVGLVFGSLDPNMKLPEILYLLGLVLFIYTVGISSGPGFFASFRRKGLRDSLLVVGILTFASVLAFIAHNVLQLKATLTVGMFTGSLTNTPALAAVLEHLKEVTPKNLLDLALAEPVVGYSITYPIGVIGVILAIQILQRVWKINYVKEAQNLRDLRAGTQSLQNRTILVTKLAATQETVGKLMERNKWEVVFGRLKRGNTLTIADSHTLLQMNDLVSVVGSPEDLTGIIQQLGEPSNEQLELDRSQLDYRRIFVSNPKLTGLPLRDLNLPQQFGAIVTRVRRGDIEFIPHGDTVLEPGDRVRVVTPRENMEVLSKFFGDSYRSLSEVDVLSFSLGIALGLLLGLVPVPLPGGVTLKLGFAGGPLVVALILGSFARTGPLVWTLPYSANLTLRQLGLVLFLAGVGTRAGYPFASTFTKGGGIYLLLAGAVITCTVALVTLWIGHKLLKIPMGLLIGMLAGIQTQPAVLGFALEQTGNDLPNIGYASVYPVAIISKIVLAQLLLSLLL